MRNLSASRTGDECSEVPPLIVSWVGADRPLPLLDHQMVPGAHGCLRYSDDAYRRAGVVSYFRSGLDVGDRLVYFSSPSDEDAGGFLQETFDVATLVDKGHLVVADARDYSLTGGTFDPAKFLEALDVLIYEASRDGYEALRIYADGSWVMPFFATTAEWLDFELGLTRVLAGRPALALCGFSTKEVGRVPEAAFDAVHFPSVGASPRPNPFCVSFDAQGGVVVYGEIDRFVATEAREVLSRALAAPGVMTLDLGGLTFSDGAGTSAVLDALGDAGPGGIEVRNVPVLFNKIWKLLGPRDWQALSPSTPLSG